MSSLGLCLELTLTGGLVPTRKAETDLEKNRPPLMRHLFHVSLCGPHTT